MALLGGAAAWPLAARAQQPAMPVIGFLNSGSPDPQGDRVRGFRQGLSEAGYDEGRNVTIEYRWAEGRNDRLPELAAELVRRRVSLLAPVGIPASLAAKQATTTIPIVFSIAADPVEAGLVPSLSRPSGNLTGVTSLNVELAPKKLEMLHALLPGAKSIALMVNPTNPIVADTQSRELRVAAASLALQLHVVEAGTEQDFESAFARMQQLRVDGLVIGTDLLYVSRSERLAASVVRHAMPAIFQFSEFTAAGGLMSYGGSVKEWSRQAGAYAGRILKGDKPADLPVMQSTKVELIVNLKAARSLGLEVPPTLLARADEVIE